MKRSSSSSAIPVPRLSRLPVRESLHPLQNRGGSMNRPSVHEKHLPNKIARSSSNSNLADIPHGNKRSGSLVRQNFCTPLSQHGYSRLSRKSPGLSSLKKDTRPITDKQWQVDQLSKVRSFISKHFGDLELYDVSSVKSGLSLDMFVSLMNSYLQSLDDDIFVRRDNYMEEVPKILKSFGYPANVKSSLMKTVNTPHAWPHILAIFSWLSDLISEIKIPDDYAPFSGIHNVVFEDTLELLRQLNINKEPEEVIRQKCLDKLDKKIVEYLNLNVNELMTIDNEIERLQAELEKSEIINKGLQNNIQAIQTETTELTEKCNNYEHQSKTFITQLEQQKKKFLEKVQKMGEEVVDLREKERGLQAVIDSQPYSLLQKEELAKEIANLKVIKELGENRRLEQQQLIHKYDSELTELMHRIHSSAYKYNSTINKLELSNPEFSKLHIRESGFARMDTEKELIGITNLLEGTMDKMKEATHAYDNDIEKLVKEEQKLKDSLNDLEKEVQELDKLDAELAHTLEFETKQADLKRRQLSEQLKKDQNDLTDLTNLRIDLTPLENQVRSLKKQKQELQELLDKNKQESLFFMQQLQKQMNQTALTYMDIMSSISEAITNEMETASDVEHPPDSQKAL